MGVVLVFEPASDAHWMKDVVQFPNALSEFSPSKLITDSEWYLNGCKKAANVSEILILYPWYGDAFKGAKIFKIKRWMSFKKAFVILKTDGLLKEKSQSKALLKERIRDYFKYFFFDKIVCENLDIYSKLKLNHAHLNAKITFIPNCPLEIYYSSQVTPYHGRAKTFLFVGRISAVQKGVDILLNHWLKIFSKIKDWKMQLVGPCSDDFKNLWQSKIRDANAQSTVEWCPAASPEELRKYYTNARVVVCSSRDESGPIVLSEAIVSGCAFVGTSVGEIPDLLKDLPGLVNDVKKLSDEMLLFALNDNLAMKQAIALREKMGDRKWSEQVRKIVR
jgi:glycosyltransferase involved in cell wall biosynthesis